MAEFREIKIRDVQSNGDLILSSDKLKAHKKDTIIWTIKKGILVESIVAIVPKDPLEQTIFEDIVCDGATWRGTIREGAPEKDFEYNIVWLDFNDPAPRTYDPIISVRPTAIISYQILVGCVAVVAAIIAISFFSKQKKERQQSKTGFNPTDSR